MDRVNPSTPSLLTRVLRWLAAYDRALEAQPLDLLERRVAELERRLASSARASQTSYLLASEA